LGAAGEGGISAGDFMQAGLAGIGISAGANEKTALDQALDAVEFGLGIIDFEPGGGGMVFVDADEGESAGEDGAGGEVEVADGIGIVEEEDAFAAGFGEGGPALIDDRFAEGALGAADIIGTEDTVGGDDGEDFSFQRIQKGGGPGDGLGQVGADGVRFQFQEEEERDVVGVGVRPGHHLAEGLGEGGDGGLKIDIGDVKDFGAWGEQGLGVGGYDEGEAEFGGAGDSGWVGEQAALGIGIEIEFDLADAKAFELLGQGPMGIGQGIGLFGGPGTDEGVEGGMGGEVIGIMGAEDLDMIEARAGDCRYGP
jgi:hypothetical protein